MVLHQHTIIYLLIHLYAYLQDAALGGASTMGRESPMQRNHRNSILPVPQQGTDQSQAILHETDQSPCIILTFILQYQQDISLPKPKCKLLLSSSNFQFLCFAKPVKFRTLMFVNFGLIKFIYKFNKQKENIWFEKGS